MKTTFSFVRLIRPVLSLAVVLACAGGAWAQRGNSNVSLDGKTPDQLVADFMAANKVPGVSVAVAQTPYVTRIVGYGYSDTGRKLLVSSNTLFPIGRMGEGFTAVAVLQLAEQGKVKLDDAIEQYVAMAPPAWHGVTVRQLIQHQTGLPDYTKVTPRNPSAPPAELFQAVSEMGPTFEPGTKTEPSATNYFLLQLLIENVSGQSYEAFVRTNQFAKLGLLHTFFSAELGGLGQELPSATELHQKFLHDPKYLNPTEPATGYEGADATPVTAPNAMSLPVRASIYATAEDLVIWDMGLSGDILIKDQELKKLLFTPAKLKDNSPSFTSGPWTFPGSKIIASNATIAIGSVITVPSLTMIGEPSGIMFATGSSPGFSTAILRYTDPKSSLSIVVLANKDALDQNILIPFAADIAGAYDPALKPVRPTPTPSPHPVAPEATPSGTPKPKS